MAGSGGRTRPPGPSVGPLLGEYHRFRASARYYRGLGDREIMPARVGTFPARDVVPGYCRACRWRIDNVSWHRVPAARRQMCRRDPATLNRMGAFL